MPNRFQPIPPGTSPEQQNSIINKNFAELDNENVKKIMYGPDGAPRISLDATTGQIKVAPAGVDVTSAESDALSFDSLAPQIKVVGTFSGTLAAISGFVNTANVGTSTSQILSFSHGLGYIPMVIGAIEDTEAGYKIPLPATYVQTRASGIVSTAYNIDVDSETITLTREVVVYAPSSVGTSWPEVNIVLRALQLPAVD